MAYNRNDHPIILPTPDEFDFHQCLAYLNRSNNECLHSIEGDVLYKALRLNGEHIVSRIDSLDGENLKRLLKGL